MNKNKISKRFLIKKILFSVALLTLAGCVFTDVNNRKVTGIFGTGTLKSCNAHCATTPEGWKNCSGLSKEMISACESALPAEKPEKKGTVILADPQ